MQLQTFNRLFKPYMFTSYIISRIQPLPLNHNAYSNIPHTYFSTDSITPPSSLEQLISGGLSNNTHGTEGLVIESSGITHRCNGLMNSSIGSFVRFDNDQIGMVIELEPNACVTSSFTPIKSPVGSTVKLLTPSELEHQDNHPFSSPKFIFSPLETIPYLPSTYYKSILSLPPSPPLSKQKAITEKLNTGLNAIELLTPIGKGHRILFHGIVKTGKTNAALNVISKLMKDINGDERIIIIALTSVRKYTEFLRDLPQKLTQHIIEDPGSDEELETKMEIEFDQSIRKRVKIISPQVMDSPYSLQEVPLQSYISPLCALELAIEQRQKGRPTLIIFDDISEYSESVEKLNSDLCKIIRTPTQYVKPPKFVLPLSAEAILSSLYIHSCNCLDIGPLSTLLIMDSSLEANTLLKNLQDLADCPIEFQKYSNSIDIPDETNVIEIPIEKINLCINLDYQNQLLKSATLYLKDFLLKGEEYRRSVASRNEFGIFIDFWEHEENNSFNLFKKLITVQSCDQIYDQVDSLILARAATLFYFPNKLESYDQIIYFQNLILEVFRTYHKNQYSTLRLWLDGIHSDKFQKAISDSSSSIVNIDDNNTQDLLYSLDMALLRCRPSLPFLHPEIDEDK